MATHNGDKRTVAPQPIPGAIHSQQQGRRNSFGAWPPTFFGGMSPSSRPQTFSNGIAPPVAHPFPASGSHAAATTASGQLPDNTPAAFSGIGLFRRFSASGASADGSQTFGQAAARQQYQNHHPVPASELADAIGRHARAELRGDALPQPKVLDEVRGSGKGDPPSRPDSRMRNLMLSGQFLI